MVSECSVLATGMPASVVAGLGCVSVTVVPPGTCRGQWDTSTIGDIGRAVVTVSGQFGYRLVGVRALRSAPTHLARWRQCPGERPRQDSTGAESVRFRQPIERNGIPMSSATATQRIAEAAEVPSRGAVATRKYVVE